jgi:hypothetical protein
MRLHASPFGELPGKPFFLQATLFIKKIANDENL